MYPQNLNLPTSKTYTIMKSAALAFAALLITVAIVMTAKWATASDHEPVFGFCGVLMTVMGVSVIVESERNDK
jgi:hypothetical protein